MSRVAGQPRLTASVLAWAAILVAILQPFPATSAMKIDAQPPRQLTLFGASYVQQWGTPVLPGFVVANKGVGGEETTQLRARFQRDVLAQRPEVLVLWGHFNDIVRAPGRDYEAAKKRARANLQFMHEQARASGIQVYLATEVTLPPATGVMNTVRGWVGSLRGKQDYRTTINGHIREVNQWLRRYAREHQVPLLDLENAMNGDDGHRRHEYTQEDGSHISAAGYQALTRYAAERIR